MKDRQGMILVVVLIVVTMVGLAGFSFAEWMFLEQKAVSIRGEELQAHYAALSGEHAVRALLSQPRGAWSMAGGWVDNPDLFRGVAIAEDPLARSVCRFSVFVHRHDQDDPNAVRFGLENESARLNLAMLLEWEKASAGAASEALMQLPGMTLPVANAMLDWIDADDQTRQEGAEVDYYASLEPPYAPRNGAPQSLEELLLVKGVTRELLFGTQSLDADRELGTTVGSLTGSSAATPPRADAAVWPWASLLTLHSAERNTTPGGQPRIFINDADLAAMHQRLLQVFDREWADYVVLYRQYGPYEGSKTATEGTSIEVETTRPGRFEVSSIVDLIGAKIQMERPGSQDPVIIDSPFRPDRLAMPQYLPRLMDHMTVVEASRIVGRVNINEARESVLRAVPGIDRDLAARIVASRRTELPDGDDPGRRQIAWLLTEELIDKETLKPLMPYITTQGSVFRGHVIGFFDEPGPTTHVEFVIDASQRPPRQVLRKDLGLFGPPLPLELLGRELDRPGGAGASPGRHAPAPGTPGRRFSGT